MVYTFIGRAELFIELCSWLWTGLGCGLDARTRPYTVKEMVDLTSCLVTCCQRYLSMTLIPSGIRALFDERASLFLSLSPCGVAVLRHFSWWPFPSGCTYKTLIPSGIQALFAENLSRSLSPSGGNSEYPLRISPGGTSA